MESKEEQFVTVKILLRGTKNEESGQELIEKPRPTSFKESIVTHFKVFQSILLHESPEQIGNIIWLNLHSYPDISDQELELLLNFIQSFDSRIDKRVECFTGIEPFNAFSTVVTKLDLDSKLELTTMREEVFKQHPILVLIDVGGSILYRAGDRVAGLERPVDCQIKKHFHYYRPYFDDYIKGLIEHPRVKFGIYTSIMRKNVMPLLYKIFDKPKLRASK